MVVVDRVARVLNIVLQVNGAGMKVASELLLEHRGRWIAQTFKHLQGEKPSHQPEHNLLPGGPMHAVFGTVGSNKAFHLFEK
jgi:hypothetical protein